MASAARLWRIDAMKGIAIALVVITHAYYPAPPSARGIEREAGHLLYFAGHLAVPAFFSLSGYLFAHERRSPRGILARKASTILAPTLVWSAVALVIRATVSGLDFEQAVLDALLLNAAGQYYYVFVLALLLAAGLLLRGHGTRTLSFLAAAGIALTVIRVAIAERYPADGALESTLLYRDPLIWAGFFLLGYRAAHAPFSLAAPAKIALLLTVVASLAWWAASGAFDTSYFTVPMILAGVAVACLAANSAASVPGAPPRRLMPVALLGRHSFAVFLIHMPLFIGLVSDEVFTDAWGGSYLTRMAFRFLIGFGGSLFLVTLVRLAVPDAAARLAGFQGRPPTPPRARPKPARRRIPGRASSPAPHNT